METRHSHNTVVQSVDAFAKLVKAITPPEELERLRRGEPIEQVLEDAIMLTDEALQSVLGRPLWFPSDVSVGNCSEDEMRRDHDLVDSVWEICADLRFFMK